jgi:hypothetical protein
MMRPAQTWSCFASDFVVLVLSEAVLSATVLVLDGFSNCSDADRRSRRFAGTCGPIGRIARLDLFEYEYECRDAEYEYEKKHEQSIGPKCSIGRF